MADVDKEEREEACADAVVFLANALDADLKAEKGRAQVVFDKLTRVLEKSRLKNSGAQMALVAMFAGGVIAQHCREAERAANARGENAEGVPFMMASAFGTLMQAYLQQFFQKIELPRMDVN